MKQKIYLDHAAATPMDSRVALAMQPYLSDKFYNPSATYLAAKDVLKDINRARSTSAHWLGCSSEEIIFVAGGTEANNLAVCGIMNRYPEANLVVSSIEHESVIKPAEKYKYKLIPVSPDGQINLEKLESLIDDQTVLVSVMYANNEIGTVQPLSKISKLLQQIRTNRSLSNNQLPLYFHSDACQTPAYLDLHVKSLGVDLMTLNSGKIYGSKQFGALYLNRQIKLLPQILGGGQERGYRSGTENPANIIGFAEALNLAQSAKAEESRRLKQLQAYFIDLLTQSVPNLKVNGSIKNRLPNNVHVTIAGQDNELLLMKLDEIGIQCASGSACNASSDEISLTLTAIGLTRAEARSSLRFSMGKSTSKNDIDYVVDGIVKNLQ